MRTWLLVLLSAALLSLGACGPGGSAPTEDGSVADDGGSMDAGARDADVDAVAADASVDSGRDGALTDSGAGVDASVDSGTIVDSGTSVDPGMDSGSVDAGMDAAVDLSCLGDSRTLVISHHLPYATVGVGGGAAPPSGLFLLDLATTASAIDLNAFSPRPVASGCNPSLLWQSCGFADLDFFGSWGPVTLTTQNLSGLGGVSEAGILGTDFFAAVALFLDYDAHEVRRSFSGGVCSDATLRAAGMAPLSTTGFYASDLSRLRPMTDVDSTAPSFARVPNVPTVPVRIGGADAVAQLDTGFDDTLAPSAINVNMAFFDAIQAADPGALVRDPGNDLALSTCVVGVVENVYAYTLASGRTLDFIASDGSVAASLTGVRVFVKNTPASARSCGGIGTWTAPASQLAASLHAALGQLFVDPFSSRVWIPRR